MPEYDLVGLVTARSNGERLVLLRVSSRDDGGAVTVLR